VFSVNNTIYTLPYDCVFGNSTSASEPCFYSYDLKSQPKSWETTVLSQAAYPLYNIVGAATVLDSKGGAIFIGGGTVTKSGNPKDHPQSQVFKFDASKLIFLAIAPLPNPLVYAAAVLVEEDIYVVGGYYLVCFRLILNVFHPVVGRSGNTVSF
jgi:N-acetylneuraminic acid mutarotase